MSMPFGASEILAPLQPLAGLIPGWKTSEAKLTSIAGAIFALGQAAEGLGLVHPGTAGGMWPVLALVGLYVASRTVLKARQGQAAPGQPSEAAAPPEAAPDLATELAELIGQAVGERQRQAADQIAQQLTAALGQITPKKET